MPTVIDSLVVELGLDPSKFSKGQRQALADFKKTQEEAKKSGRDIEAVGRQTLDFLSTLQTKVVGTLSLFVGGRGVKEFASWVTHTAAETGRMSRLLGTNTEALSAWRGAATVTGGSAEGMTASISGLVQQFQMFSLTGESSVIPYFRALGIQISDAQGKMRPFGDIMIDIANRFSKLEPEKARAFGAALGFDDGTINLLIKGGVAVARLIDEQKKLGLVTEADAKAAEAATKSWNEMEQAATGLGRTLVTGLSPHITTILNKTTELFKLWQRGPEELEKDSQKMQDDLRKRFGEPTGFFKGLSDWLSGERNAEQILGDGFPATPQPTKNYSESQSDISKLVAMGWSREAAVGLVAGFQAESAGNHKAIGDGGQAYGLGQWHPDRQANFARFAGKDIRQSTRDEQLAFANWELNNTEKKAGDALRKATSAADAARIASRWYERPANATGEAEKRAALAIVLQKAPPSTLGLAAAAQQGASGGAGSSTSTSTATTDVRVGTVTVHTQATDAAGIARDIGPAIMNDAFAAQANSGPS